MVYDPSTLPNNTLQKIEEQIDDITAVVTEVNQTIAYTGVSSQDEVNAKNQAVIDNISKARDFLRAGHYHNMTKTHEYLIRHAADNPDWARCDVMFVEGINLVFDNKRQMIYQKYKGVNVYILTGLIYTFSQPYYLNDNNGLQKLVNHLSIKSLDDTKITGREAAHQENTWSHLHGLKVIRDVNPENGTFETLSRNKDRRECEWTLWGNCRCLPKCKYRALRMHDPQFLEEMTQRELVMMRGMCPGKDEEGIRRYIQDQIRNYFEDNDDLEYPAYLENDNLLTPRYSAPNHIGGMRDRVDLSTHDAGIFCPVRGRRITFEDIVLRRDIIPQGTIQEIEQAVTALQPLLTVLVREEQHDNNEEEEEDDDELSQVITDNWNRKSQANVDTENGHTFRHTCVVPCILRMVQEGSIVTVANFTGGGDPRPTEEELEDKCWFKNSALGQGAQQHYIKFGTEWSTNKAVNNWMTTNKPGNTFSPTLPRSMKITQIVYDYWTTAWNGDIGKCLDYFSILSPPTGISPILAYHQFWDASHLAHLDLQITIDARCLNTSFITNEHCYTNSIRTCGNHPWRPILEQCQHSPTCKQCIFKLHEGYLLQVVNMAYLNKQLGGPFHDNTWLEIEAVYLDIFRRAYDAAEGVEVPGWLEERRGNNEAGRTTVWECEYSCGLEFSTEKEADDHAAEEHSEEEQEEEQEEVVVRDTEITRYSDWEYDEWVLFATGLIYWKEHTRKWANTRSYMLRQNQTINLTSTARFPDAGRTRWTDFKVRHDIVQLFDECTGGLGGCTCVLHTRFPYIHTP